MLRTENLSFKYRRAENAVISDLTASFSRGEFSVVAGRSGAGKSTLLYLLGLLLRPQSGTISLDGRIISSLNDRESSMLRAKTFGFVFQDAQLDRSRSMLDNVLEPCLYAIQRKSSLRSRAGDLLEELEVAVPLHHRAADLSGGQAQRVAMCRALLLDPPVILADEPTGNLDQANSELIVRRLEREADVGRIVVVVSHDRDVVGRASHVLELP